MSKIRIDYWKKPYPFRDHDFQATYIGCEPDEHGAMPVGYGASRAEALADLLRNYPRDEVIEELRERKLPKPPDQRKSCT